MHGQNNVIVICATSVVDDKCIATSYEFAAIGDCVAINFEGSGDGLIAIVVYDDEVVTVCWRSCRWLGIRLDSLRPSRPYPVTLT